VRKLFEEAEKIVVRVDTEDFGSFDEGEEGGADLCSSGRTGEQSVFPATAKKPDGVSIKLAYIYLYIKLYIAK
jgi:hypothetical protein